MNEDPAGGCQLPFWKTLQGEASFLSVDTLCDPAGNSKGQANQDESIASLCEDTKSYKAFRLRSPDPRETTA